MIGAIKQVEYTAGYAGADREIGYTHLVASLAPWFGLALLKQRQ
jgi:hypothetical protein